MTARDRQERLVWTLLGTILVVAAAARFAGLQFGLPHVRTRPDELAIASMAVRFWETGDLNPHFFDYPSFYLYVLGAIYGLYFAWGLAVGRFDSVAAFVASWPTDWVPFFLLPRVLGAVCGTATVFVVFAIGRRLFDRDTALVAAFFMALAFLHVRDSHYGTTDVPMVLLVLLSMLYVVRAHQGGSARDVVLAGVFGGLAMATKYNAVMLAVPMALSGVIRVIDAPAGGRRDAVRAARPVLLVVVGAATFFGASPFVLLDFGKTMQDLEAVAAIHRVGLTPPELLGVGWVYHARFSLPHGLGVPLYAAGLVGIVWLFATNLRAGLLLCSYPLAYYVAAGGGYMVFVRYMLPVVPFLCLTAGVVGVAAARAVSPALRLRPSVAAAVLAGLVVWPSAESVVRFDWLMRQRDSRLVAADWVLANVPEGAVIHQAGNLYGHLQLEPSRPFRYRYWTWDRRGRQFLDEEGRSTDAWPEWIVVHRSALPYSRLTGLIALELDRSYTLEHLTRADAALGDGNVYDVQDGFFAPYGGFEKVSRPGPNIYVYRRREPL